MINIIVSQEIESVCPDFVGAAVEARVTNTSYCAPLWDEIHALEEEFREKLTTESLKELSGIAATRRVYKACGKDPSRYRPASEQLIRRMLQGKELYQIDTLVDLVNLASIAYGYSIGGFDADKISGNTLTLGIGRDGEPYEGIGRGTLNIAGLPVYRDALGGIGTPTSDHERTKMTLETQHLLVLINGYDGNASRVAENATFIVRLLKKYCQSGDEATYHMYGNTKTPLKQAMVFAAGLGTRLKPLTDTMPKALVPVAGKPLLWHVIQKLKAAGYERIVVNVHHLAQQIVDYLHDNSNFGLDILISDESDKLLETGGGIKKALPLFDPTEPILIHNVDILSNLNLAELHADAPLLVVSERKTKRYLQFDDAMRLIGWKNIETGELKGREGRSLAFSGIHVLHPSLIPLMDEWPDRFPIMDFYLKVCAGHLIKGYEAHDLRLLDVGKLNTLEEANEFITQL